MRAPRAPRATARHERRRDATSRAPLSRGVFGIGTIGSIDRLRLSTLRTAMAITVSDAGLGLYAFVFTALSIVVRGVFDACNVANLPPIAEAGLTREDCEQWSQSWIKNAPRGKESAAELLVLFFHVLVRIEQNFFLCSSIACWYALFKCTAVQRKPMHLFLALVAICCAASDATFAGLPIGLGTTSLVLSDAAKTTIMIPFVPLWLLICVLNAAAWADAVVKEKKA